MSFQRSWARRVVLFVCCGATLTCLAAACSSSSGTATGVKLAEGCSLNSNCDDPLVCTFARCHEECTNDRDCPGEQRCVTGGDKGVCQLPLETACTRDSQCEGEQVCGIDGECRDTCKTDDDCVATDQLCAASGECASTLVDKDLVDEDGNIEKDPFNDQGSGGAGGGGGQSNGGGSSGGRAGMSGGGKSSGGDSGEGGELSVGGAGGDPGLVCPTGSAECGGDDPTDCETNIALPSSCGGCTTVCSADHATTHCDAPTGYVCVVDSCATGYADCDEDGTTGCEALLASDAKNCGACGNDCAGGTCKAGVCSAAIVMDPGGPTVTSTFADAVLVGNTIVASVVTGNKYELRTVTLPPTDPPSEGVLLHTFATASNRREGTLVADADYVYWATNSSPYAVYRKPLNNPAANIQEMFTAPGQVQELKLTLSAFYYFGYQPSTAYGFFTAAKTLGATATPIPNMQGRYSSIGYMTIAGVGANARLYWPEYSPTPAKYQLFTAPLAGEAPAVVDTDLGSGSYIGTISDGTYAYWNIAAANGKIKRANSGANPTMATDVVVSTSYPGYPGNGMIADATYLYYTDNTYNIWRTKKDGSAVPEAVLTRGSSTVYLASMFAIDATYIYGAAYSGQIVRVRKAPPAAP